MASIICGVRTSKFKDKQSGDLIPSVELHIIKKNALTYGFAVETVFISSENPIYDYLYDACKGEWKNLNGYRIFIERSTKGYLNDLDLGEYTPDDYEINL